MKIYKKIKIYLRMAHPGGFEPPTYRLEGGCSNPLSYGCMFRYFTFFKGLNKYDTYILINVICQALSVDNNQIVIAVYLLL